MKLTTKVSNYNKSTGIYSATTNRNYLKNSPKHFVLVKSINFCVTSPNHALKILYHTTID